MPLTSGEVCFGHLHPSAPEQVRVCWSAHSAIPFGHRSAGYGASSAAARLRHRRVPLQTPRTTRDLDALRAMAEANPQRGFPRLRRAAVSSAGRWEAASGAVMQQQERGCSRSFPEFSIAAQRLCSAAQQNPPLGFDAVSVRGRPTFVCVVRGCTRCRAAGSGALQTFNLCSFI